MNYTWNTPNGIAAQTLDEELIKLMKQSGCYEITLAIESGDETVLHDVLKKPIDLNQTLQIAKTIKANGINTYGFFIIGFPQETKQQIYNTLNFMEKIQLDRVSLFMANPLPGTEIFDICQKKGYLKGNNSNRFIDYFNASFETPEFSMQWLTALRREWYWKYNIKLLLRNPFKFFKIYSIFIFKRPLMMLRIAWDKIFLPTLESMQNARKK